MTTDATAIDVVIVNWNSADHLTDCLAALARSNITERLKAVVVDNASTDGSAERIKGGPLDLTVVRNAENRGFAAACNQGASHGTAPLILFLNPDVRVLPDAVAAAAIAFLGPSRKRVGVVGAQLLDPRGAVVRSCARAPSLASLMLQAMFLDRLCPALVKPHFMREWDHAQTREVDQVMGAFLMIRRDLFRALGGFNQKYFLYYEDVELCLKARAAGLAVLHCAEAKAFHAAGGSTSAVKDLRLFHSARSRIVFAASHYGSLAARALMVFILMIEMPVRLLHASLARSPSEGGAVLRAVALFWQRVVRRGDA